MRIHLFRHSLVQKRIINRSHPVVNCSVMHGDIRMLIVRGNEKNRIHGSKSIYGSMLVVKLGGIITTNRGSDAVTERLSQQRRISKRIDKPNRAGPLI